MTTKLDEFEADLKELEAYIEIGVGMVPVDVRFLASMLAEIRESRAAATRMAKREKKTDGWPCSCRSCTEGYPCNWRELYIGGK